VEGDLPREYSKAVFYADDAFARLHIMEDLATANGKKQAHLQERRTSKSIPRPRRSMRRRARCSRREARS